jgi:hypothetical protein
MQCAKHQNHDDPLQSRHPHFCCSDVNNATVVIIIDIVVSSDICMYIYELTITIVNSKRRRRHRFYNAATISSSIVVADVLFSPPSELSF